MKFLCLALALLGNTLLAQSRPSPTATTLWLTATLPGFGEGEPLTVVLYDSTYLSPQQELLLLPPRYIVTRIQGGKLDCHLEGIHGTTYLQVRRQTAPDGSGGKDLFPPLLVEGGETLHFETRKEGGLQFRGRGAAKWEAALALETLYSTLKEKGGYIPQVGLITRTNYLAVLEGMSQEAAALREALLGCLQSYQHRLTPFQYGVLAADAYARAQYDAVNNYLYFLSGDFPWETPEGLPQLQALYARYLKTPDLPSAVLGAAHAYAALQLVQSSVELRLQYGLAYQRLQLFRRIDASKGLLREKVVTMYLLQAYDYLPAVDSLVSTYLPTLQTAAYGAVLSAFHGAQKVGTPAFDFSLPDEKGAEVSLRHYRGKVVFLDFWYVGCGPCAVYYKYAVKGAEAYFKEDTGVVFLSIAVEKDFRRWKEQLGTQMYTGPEAVNLYTGPALFNSPVIRYYAITACPRSFLIGKDGRLAETNAEALGNASGGAQRLIERIEKEQQK